MGDRQKIKPLKFMRRTEHRARSNYECKTKDFVYFIAPFNDIHPWAMLRFNAEEYNNGKGQVEQITYAQYKRELVIAANDHHTRQMKETQA